MNPIAWLTTYAPAALANPALMLWHDFDILYPRPGVDGRWVWPHENVRRRWHNGFWEFSSTPISEDEWDQRQL